MYVPRMGWTYWIILHLIAIPLTVYIGTFIRNKGRDKWMLNNKRRASASGSATFSQRATRSSYSNFIILYFNNFFN